MLGLYGRTRAPIIGPRRRDARKNATQLCVFLLVSAACLSAGLWTQQHLVSVAALRAVEQEAWQKLEGDANSQFHQLENMLDQEAADGKAAISLLRTANPLLGGLRATVLFVDSDWHLLESSPKLSTLRESQSGPAEAIGWTAEKQTVETSKGIGRAIRGRVVWDGCRQLAVALPLRNRDGYCLLCIRESDVRHARTLLTGAMIPISGLTLVWTMLLTGIAAFLLLSPSKDAIPRDRSRTSADALRQAQNLIRTRDSVIFGLAKLADSRDGETGHHLERISLYCRTMAFAMCEDPRFSGKLDPSFVRLIGISSALHDIGKVGIEDSILHKPGPLSARERTCMERHAAIGERCIREIELHLGQSNFLEMAREIAASHHEHWDGNGYPRGLIGEQIPLAARIVAIADVYDALASTRIYKPAQDHETCREYMLSHAGSQFDPTLVEIWLRIHDKFQHIAQRFTSPTEQGQASTFSVAELDEELGNDTCSTAETRKTNGATSAAGVTV